MCAKPQVREMIAWTLMFAIAVDAPVLSAAEQDRPFIVFAAASLTEAVTDVSTAFTEETKIPVKTSFAASSVLARQIEAGAPAMVFFAADEQWMDYLQSRNLLVPGSRRDVLGNQLVLVAPADSTATVKIASGPAFLQGLGGARIATGDPESVPVGKYAKAALIKLGVWEQVEGRLVRAEDVRSALAFVARGDAPFGIVYLTDAKIEKRVKLLDVFPRDTYPPIRYPIAMTAGAGAEARRFIDFVTGNRAAGIFQQYGFEVVAGKPTSAADTPPCGGFIWDVSRELTVMSGAPRVLTTAVKPSGCPANRELRRATSLCGRYGGTRGGLLACVDSHSGCRVCAGLPTTHSEHRYGPAVDTFDGKGDDLSEPAPGRRREIGSGDCT